MTRSICPTPVAATALSTALVLSACSWGSEGFGTERFAEGAECAAQEDGHLLVTADCTDPDYTEPVVDSTSEEEEPVAHTLLEGHFEGTDTEFSIALPSRGSWEGRFFQRVYPTTGAEVMEQDIASADESGAYAVSTNSSSGYRTDAAVAKLSRAIAEDHYGVDQDSIYGYVYGGSGGSYQTVGAAENTDQVWQGAIPYVMGTPTSIPTNFFLRAFAGFALEDSAYDIAESVRPGGDGEPYAGLDDVESSVLREVTEHGIPLETWEDPTYLLGLGDETDNLLSFAAMVEESDPEYVEDFWGEDGYLGAEDSDLGEMYRDGRDRQETEISEIEEDGEDLTIHLEGLDRVERPDFFSAVMPGAGAGEQASLPGQLNADTGTYTVNAAELPDELAQGIEQADTLVLDNSSGLAMTVYHRYQVPEDDSFTTFDQHRDADGEPLAPQREMQLSSGVAKETADASYTGEVTMPTILFSTMHDADAFPWHADWYADRVRESSSGDADDQLRVWFIDNADHHDGTVADTGIGELPREQRLAEYAPALEQALRDLAAWVEKDAEIAPSSQYEIDGGQVSLTGAPGEQGGIQPQVELSAEGGASAETTSGEEVAFTGRAVAPEGTGEIARAEWDPQGEGDFEELEVEPGATELEISETATYEETGEHLPILRITTQRVADSEFAEVSNLARVHVSVSE